MNMRLFRTISILVIGILMLGACTGTAPSSQPDKQPLRIGWSLWPGYYPLAIAVEKGMFTKHGVEVEPVFYAAYGNVLPDLASGMLDAGALTLSDTLFDSLSTQVKVVMVLDNSDGADQVIASADINGPEDLAGKRIGVQSSTVSGVLLVRQMLERSNVALTDVSFVQIPPEGVPAAIPSQIDAGYTYDPYTSAALAKGNKIIFTSADAPGLIVDVLAFRKDVIDSRPEDVKAVVAAWFEAVQYWKDHPSEGNAIIAKATGLTPEEISSEGVKLFGLEDNMATYVEGSNQTSVYFVAQNALKYLVGAGDITNPVAPNTLLDPSFLK